MVKGGGVKGKVRILVWQAGDWQIRVREDRTLSFGDDVFGVRSLRHNSGIL